jgi:hypothetical protein
MKPYLTDIPFLERHSVDLIAAAAAFAKARGAAQMGNPAEAAEFRRIAERNMDRLEQLYADELKAKPARRER